MRNKRRIMECVQNVFMRLFPPVRHRRDAQTSCTRPVCGFDRQGALLNLDVGEFVKTE